MSYSGNYYSGNEKTCLSSKSTNNCLSRVETRDKCCAVSVVNIFSALTADFLKSDFVFTALHLNTGLFKWKQLTFKSNLKVMEDFKSKLIASKLFIIIDRIACIRR